MRMSGGPRWASIAPSASCDEAVDQRLRVHDHVDALVRRAEQVVGLHHLQALVHQRRRVDRDLAAHRPGRVRERLLDGHVRELLARAPAEGAAAGGDRQPLDGSRRLAGDQLVQRRVLGVDGHDPRARRFGQRGRPARRRRPATPCWPARGRCPRRAWPRSGRGPPSRRARSARGRRPTRRPAARGPRRRPAPARRSTPRPRAPPRPRRPARSAARRGRGPARAAPPRSSRPRARRARARRCARTRRAPGGRSSRSSRGSAVAGAKPSLRSYGASF